MLSVVSTVIPLGYNDNYGGGGGNNADQPKQRKRDVARDVIGGIFDNIVNRKGKKEDNDHNNGRGQSFFNQKVFRKSCIVFNSRQLKE